MARPIDPSAKRNVVTCRVDDKTKEWLSLWRPGSETATQLADVIERARQFWPQGPDKFGREPDPTKPPKPRLTPRIARYAAAQGISKSEAMNRAWKAFEAAQEQDHAPARPGDR